jgi:integrase
MRRRSAAHGNPAPPMVNVELGSVYERGRDGRWVAILWRDGKRTAYYGTTKGEARENRRRAYHQALHGLALTPARRRITTGEYLARWVERYNPPAESTKVRARQHVAHAIPALGNIPLEELSGDDLTALYDAKIELWLSTVDDEGKPCKTSPRARGTLLGTSPMTTFNMHRVLFQALRAASRGRNRLLLHNPAEDAEPPYVPPRDLSFLDVEETARLIEVASGRRYGSILITAVQIGARQGELLARQWKDYDPRVGTLSISSSKKRGQKVGPTKTRQSRRTLTLPAASRAALDADRNTLMAAGSYRETDLIWPATGGTLLDPSHLLRGIFQPMLSAASCPTIRFHDLRHTAATLLLRTMQPHQVAEILGHTTAALIWKTYGHVIPKDLQKAVESMDALFPAPSAQAVASPPAPGTSNETSTRTTPQDRRPALDTALIPVGAGV